jgi:hypothetical protein
MTKRGITWIGGLTEIGKAQGHFISQHNFLNIKSSAIHIYICRQRYLLCAWLQRMACNVPTHQYNHIYTTTLHATKMMVAGDTKVPFCSIMFTIVYIPY